MRLGNGRWESAKFNERLQVTELALGTSDADGSLWKLNYDYGELNTDGSVNTAKNTGNIAKQTLSFNGLTNPLVQTYKYDSLYRLTEVRETNGTGTSAPQTWKEAFSYDRYGNRFGHDKFTSTNVVPLDSKTNPTINPTTNRFIVSSAQAFAYDKNGNLTTDGDGRRFTFNGDNKQREIRDASNNIVGRYYYDGEGNRVRKVTNMEETVFVYSAGKLVEEYSTQTPPSNPTTSYTVTDQLLSPRIITDSNGNVVSRRDFMPFGEEIVNNIGERDPTNTNLKYGAADGVRQKFTGYQKDEETHLDFAEARMYEDRHGRFTAVDPLLSSGNSANPQTFNRFVYVGNNPIVATDPTGMQTNSNPNSNGRWVQPIEPTSHGVWTAQWITWDKDLPDGWRDQTMDEMVFKPVDAKGWEVQNPYCGTIRSFNSETDAKQSLLNINTMFGTAATIMESPLVTRSRGEFIAARIFKEATTAIRNGQWYSSKFQRFYSLKFYGNQYVSQALTLSQTESAANGGIAAVNSYQLMQNSANLRSLKNIRGVSKAAFVLSTLDSLNQLRTGDQQPRIYSVLDGVFGAVGTFGGLPGAAISLHWTYLTKPAIKDGAGWVPKNVRIVNTNMCHIQDFTPNPRLINQ